MSKIETEVRQPSVDFARLCDAALEAGGALVDLVTGRGDPPSTPDGAAGSGDDGCGDGNGGGNGGGSSAEVWALALEPGGGTRFAGMHRDELLALGTPGVPGLGIAPVGGASDYAAALAAHQAQFTGLRRLGQVSSPAFVFPMAIAHSHALRGLAAAAPARHRPALFRLAARCVEFAGWMAQEAGDDRLASWCTDCAVRLAAAGGDRELARYALIRHANMAMYRHDAITTIELARQAQSDPEVSSRIRGLAAQREAQGHALAGDYDQCRRALDRSAALLAEPVDASGGSPTLGTSNTPDPAAMAAGWCCYELGRPAEAAHILDREVARLPPSAHRARARWGTTRALAHAANGDIDHACELTGALVDEATAVDSATIRYDLRRLAQLLARWRSHPPVRKLRPRLAAALHRPAGSLAAVPGAMISSATRCAVGSPVA